MEINSFRDLATILTSIAASLPRSFSVHEMISWTFAGARHRLKRGVGDLEDMALSANGRSLTSQGYEMDRVFVLPKAPFIVPVDLSLDGSQFGIIRPIVPLIARNIRSGFARIS
jgi:hypothetical protein